MGWVAKVNPNRFTPEKETWYPLCRRAGWAPVGVWTCTGNLTLTWISSPDRPTLTDYAIPPYFPPYNLKLKNARSYTFSPSYAFVEWGLMKHREILYFILVSLFFYTH